ncbi:MAG: GIY-YIG nuclease family protein [Pseudomonadota bacterium]|nr:GIY-YIG nuclease family protein [Pseudomonadota bacterium]
MSARTAGLFGVAKCIEQMIYGPHLRASRCFGLDCAKGNMLPNLISKLLPEEAGRPAFFKYHLRDDEPMGDKSLFLFKNYVEHVPKDKIREMVPELVRGIYVLFNENNDKLFSENSNKKMDVVYIGRSTLGKTQGVGARLLNHMRTKNEKKEKPWSHFSVFEVWDNVSDLAIAELEALILHIYARDGSANKLNIQRNSKLFLTIRRNGRNEWKNRS